jgi:site-specific recombinase XerD
MISEQIMSNGIRTFIEEFIMAKSVEGKSEATLRWYRHTLMRFADFLGQEATLRDFTVDRARAYIAGLQSEGVRYSKHPLSEPRKGKLSAYSIHGYVRAIKAFSRWLKDEGYTPSDMLARIKRPKLPQTIVDTLTDEEIQKIFAGINPGTFTGARNLAVYLLLLDTGIRASELCSLSMSNVNLKVGEIKVVGKGSKERVVSLVGNTRLALSAYINYFRPDTDTDRVFVTYDGAPLTYNALIHGMKTLGKRLGIPRLHPHLFRHTFAVKWLVNGGDVITLQKTLGHTSLEVTRLYLHLSNQQMKVMHDQYSPVGKLDLRAIRREAHA